tara:strand:- start:170 stop:1501 length:1332 start_codon:yes stop_codon:yes gene_type:complete
MKSKIKKYVLTAVLSASVSLIGMGAAYAVDISETVGMAVENNPSLKIKSAEKNISKQNMYEARSAFFPQLSVTAQAGRISQNNDTTRAATTDQDDAQSYMGEGRVALTQPIFHGMANLNRYRATKDRRYAKDFEFQSNMVDVVRASVVSHIEVVKSRELVKETQSFLNSIAGYRERMQLMVNEGALGKSELLQADELIILTKNALLQYQETLSLNEASYFETVGQMPQLSMSVSSKSIEALIPRTLDDALSLAKTEHPIMRSAEMSARAFTRDANAERAGIIPRIDTEVSYSKKDQDDTLAGESENAQALVKMTWDFSVGGAYSARVKRSLQQGARAKADKERRTKAVERDVRQRYIELTSAGKRLDILAKREKANVDIFNSYEQEYDAGKRSILELINAKNKVFESKINYLNAYYKRQSAKYDLLGAMGQIHKAFGFYTAQN